MTVRRRGLECGLVAMVLALAWMRAWVPCALMVLYGIAAARLILPAAPGTERSGEGGGSSTGWAGASAAWLWAILASILFAHTLRAHGGHFGPAHWVLATCAALLPPCCAVMATARASSGRASAVALGLGLGQVAVFAGLDIGGAVGRIAVAIPCTAMALLLLVVASRSEDPESEGVVGLAAAPPFVGLLFLLIALTR